MSSTLSAIIYKAPLLLFCFFYSRSRSGCCCCSRFTWRSEIHFVSSLNRNWKRQKEPSVWDRQEERGINKTDRAPRAIGDRNGEFPDSRYHFYGLLRYSSSPDERIKRRKWKREIKRKLCVLYSRGPAFDFGICFRRSLKADSNLRHGRLCTTCGLMDWG